MLSHAFINIYSHRNFHITALKGTFQVQFDRQPGSGTWVFVLRNNPSPFRFPPLKLKHSNEITLSGQLNDFSGLLELSFRLEA